MTSLRPLSWTVMPQAKASEQYSCKRDDHWLLLANNYVRSTWENRLMKGDDGCNVPDHLSAY